jgi:hypothetical protein
MISTATASEVAAAAKVHMTMSHNLVYTPSLEALRAQCICLFHARAFKDVRRGICSAHKPSLNVTLAVSHTLRALLHRVLKRTDNRIYNCPAVSYVF